MKHTIIPVTDLQQNCSLIWCEETGKGAVIDPGDDLQPIMQSIKEHQVNVEKILITHAHFDHAGGAHELAKKLDVEIEGPHIDDLPLVEKLSEQSEGWGFPPVATFSPKRWLQQDDEITIGNLHLQVLHCPGHTPGHVVFFHAESRLVFVGDVLFKGSIGRTDFPFSNHQDLINSIKNRLWPLGDDITFVPGHGPLSTIGEERRSNQFVAD
ncbi:MAG: MBL fold metallo-hydrolase [Gammaproteobacteria bacterium]|jgi:glyoxylase-like metal-dependent hydrolase (beta-lactamase superfamily II)|nr:MBL fold metallo-hydrolase [Gammaproteobacteria bacterium]MBT4452105.1 MBL fold metallo-hydrolase [Gammaproteobacteria bacterium]